MTLWGPHLVLNLIVNMSRPKKRIITLLFDSLFIFTAFWLALMARLDDFSLFSTLEYWFLLAATLVVSLLSFIRLGLYRAVLRYMSSQAMWSVLTGVIVSALSLVGFSFFFDAFLPRTVPVIFFCLCLLFVGGSRIMVRAFLGRRNAGNKTPVIVYGAGSAGRQLATGLAQGAEYHVVAFVDDQRSAHGTVVQGVMVYPPDQIKTLVSSGIASKLLLALPSASRLRRKQILSGLEPLPLEVLTIPGMADVVSGSAKLEDIKAIGIDDLLGRDSVEPKQSLMASDIAGKVVMVTGAGGSIGSELCRQILLQKPKSLVLFELSEFSLYTIEKELCQINMEHNLAVELLPMLGSVQRSNRVQAVMESFSVQTVYHAAAYKHVPLVEHNVVEGVRNNIFGTLSAAQAAIAAKVDTFVLISTDKAVRPTNVMGATKRMAELVLQALTTTQSGTRFCMVRFGNVLGSSGSVVPLFRKQIKAGGPVTLTHPDITRYFMTIPEAAQLVIQAGAMGKGGDVFVLDMGESIKIKALATKMIYLSGFDVRDDANPGGDIEIVCTGLRPGEKLYEELLVGDDVSGTSHERIMTANEVMLAWSELEVLISKLDRACHDFDHAAIRALLLEAPAAYQPSGEVCDLVWLAGGRQKVPTNVVSLSSGE